MLFGIDYDETWTKDPEFWFQFLELAEKKGHKAVIVTGRNKPSFGSSGTWTGEPIEIAVKGKLPVVYAGNNTKREAANKAGYKVDVWIDDSPYYIDGDKPHK